MNAVKSWYHWMGRQVHTPYAIPMLIFMFFIEATIFFIPVDPLLILYCIEHRAKGWYFAMIATVASVFGGLFGYLIGFALWQTIGKLMLAYIISPAAFAQVVQWFKQYEVAAVLIAGFTPVPYKAVTIGAGFCKLPLAPFLIYSFIARGARFFLLAAIIRVWGEQIKEYIDRYFNLFVLLFVGLVIGSIWFMQHTSHS
jgi:membrane protein YqaA with SNARE-associated domain